MPANILSPYAFVDALEMGNVSSEPRAARVTLVLCYDQKQARIELPVAEPLFETEPGTEVYRRELQRLLAALQEVAASPQGIRWPTPRDRT
jgi:hypothetical protein